RRLGGTCQRRRRAARASGVDQPRFTRRYSANGPAAGGTSVSSSTWKSSGSWFSFIGAHGGPDAEKLGKGGHERREEKRGRETRIQNRRPVSFEPRNVSRPHLSAPERPLTPPSHIHQAGAEARSILQFSRSVEFHLSAFFAPWRLCARLWTKKS